jgi:hypothetical protein
VLTRKGEATRTRIVEGAAEVLRERGVVPTTLDDIRIHTATSKGQLRWIHDRDIRTIRPIDRTAPVGSPARYP